MTRGNDPHDKPWAEQQAVMLPGLLFRRSLPSQPKSALSSSRKFAANRRVDAGGVLVSMSPENSSPAYEGQADNRQSSCTGKLRRHFPDRHHHPFRRIPGDPSMGIIGSDRPYIGMEERENGAGDAEDPRRMSPIWWRCPHRSTPCKMSARSLQSSPRRRWPHRHRLRRTIRQTRRRSRSPPRHRKLLRRSPRARNLPNAPKNPVIYMPENNRPQPRKDAERERDAWPPSSGRLRPCPVLDNYKFVALGHNTIREAASGAEIRPTPSSCIRKDARLMIVHGRRHLRSESAAAIERVAGIVKRARIPYSRRCSLPRWAKPPTTLLALASAAIDAPRTEYIPRQLHDLRDAYTLSRSPPRRIVPLSLETRLSRPLPRRAFPEEVTEDSSKMLAVLGELTRALSTPSRATAKSVSRASSSPSPSATSACRPSAR